MFISIGNQTKKYMSVLGLSEYPFTTSQIRKAYLELIKSTHPDAGGDKREAQKVIEAYNAIKNLAVSDISDHQIDSAFKKIQEDQQRDIFALYDECPECKGTGQRSYSTGRVGCHECSTDVWWNHKKSQWTLLMFLKLGITNKKGLKIIKCRQCDREGNFTLRSGRKVVCRNCNGKKFKAVKCRRCGGEGYIGEERTESVNCFHCNGTGKVEIKPFNPVIPKGAVL